MEESRLPQKAVSAYLSERNIGSLRFRRLARRVHPLELTAKTAFSELFNIHKDDESGLEKFRGVYKDEAETYIDVREQVEKEFGSFRTRVLSQAVNWGIRDRVFTALKICKEASGLTRVQRAQMLQKVGYTTEESRKILSRTLVSGFIYPAIWFAEDRVPDVLGLVGGAVFS